MSKFIEEALAEVLGVKTSDIGHVQFELFVGANHWQSPLHDEEGFDHGRQEVRIEFICSKSFMDYQVSNAFGSLVIVQTQEATHGWLHKAYLLRGPETEKIAQAVFTGLSVA